MPTLGDSRFSRTLPLAVFEQLQMLLQQMKLTIGEAAVVFTEDILTPTAIARKPQMQWFTVLASEPFSALLVGTPQESSLAEYDTELALCQVELTFDPEAIASFLTQLSHEVNKPVVLNLISQALVSLRPNNAAIQSEFTLSLVEILSSTRTSDFMVSPMDGTQALVCQPLVEKALRQQVEQERLLNQVTTQIRQSLELPVILRTAVEQVRHFLQVDRLIIYQFDFRGASVSTPQDYYLAEANIEPSLFSLIPQASMPDEQWGCVTYEATASEAVPSVLNLREEEECSIYVPNCREKYHQGITYAIDDVETAYADYPCLLELLRHAKVRAKLVAPIVVQNNLWGLLIAQQCFEPRHWQDSEKMFLKQIAEHLTVAIYQAQLYAQLQQQKTTLEQRVIERTQELRDALQAAQSASRAKSEFLAAMSHELRTPLTCVIGMSATLLRWSFGKEGTKTVPIDKQRRYLQTIQESGEHLLELINDILDLSQVEAGKAVLNISEFSLSQLAHQTLSALQEKASLKNVDLEMDFQIELQSDRFCADQRRVRQILFNLLGNAVKFTPAGGQVILRVWREHHMAVFQIEDTGIGIADEHLPLLFQKFQQIETSYHRSYEGTGLGLALTKQLVELHGGRIEVESVVGEGSLFTVCLPAQLKTSSATKTTVAQGKNPSTQGSIVLLEDHEDSAMPICEILTEAGYQVVWLIDGSTALEQIELLQPKVVIVNWQLQGVDGSEISYYLRNSPRVQPVKVLALINSTQTLVQENNLSTEVDDYVSKPVELSQLLHKVTLLLAR